MKADDFSRKIENAKKKAENLRQQTAMNVEYREEIALEATQTLLNTLEELHVVEEELRQSNEELITARNSLELEKYRYEELFEFAPDGYLVTDPLGIILAANEMARLFLGVAQEHMLGKPLGVFVHQDDSQVFRQRLNEFTEHDYLTDWELTLIPLAGDSFPASLTVATSRSKDGKLTSLRWLLRDISDRKMAEDVLNQNQKNLKLSQEFAHVGNWVFDIVKNELTCSDEVYRILGLEPHSIGPNFEDFVKFVHPADWEMLEEFFIRALGNQQPKEIEHRLVDANGELHYVYEKAINFVDEHGDTIRVVGVVQDITKIKLVERDFRENQERLDLAIRGSKGGLWVYEIDPENPTSLPDTVELSAQLKMFIGYEDDEFPNSLRAWEKQIHPNDLKKVRESSQNCLNGLCKFHEVDYRIRHKDGSTRWISSRGNLQVDDKNQQRFFSGIDWDITARREVEEVLRVEEARYRALFEQTNDAVFIMDLEGRHIAANPQAVALLGYSIDELKELSYQDTSPELAQSEEIMPRLLSGENIPIYERVFRRKNGSLVSTDINVRLIKDPEGQPLYLLSNVRDITKRKHAETELAKNHSHLEEIVKERATELEQSNQEFLAEISQHRKTAQMLSNRISELDIIYDITTAMLSKLSTDSLLKYIIDQAAFLLDALSCSIFLLDEETDDLVCQAAGENIIGLRIPRDQGIGGRALLQGVTQVVDDATKDPDHFVSKDAPGGQVPHSLLVTPLLIDAMPIGVLMVIKNAGSRFHQHDIEIIEMLASQAAIAINNANLFEQAQKEIDERILVETELQKHRDQLEETIQERTEELLDVNQKLRLVVG
jgi:PAS domain S-box-containing protein